MLFYRKRGLQLDSEGDYLRLRKSAKGHLDHVFKEAAEDRKIEDAAREAE